MILPLHGATSETKFAPCVEKCIMTSGCTASRASLAGACLGALGTASAIPGDWVKLVKHSDEVVALTNQLLALREQLS